MYILVGLPIALYCSPTHTSSLHLYGHVLLSLVVHAPHSSMRTLCLILSLELSELGELRSGYASCTCLPLSESAITSAVRGTEPGALHPLQLAVRIPWLLGTHCQCAQCYEPMVPISMSWLGKGISQPPSPSWGYYTFSVPSSATFPEPWSGCRKVLPKV